MNNQINKILISIILLSLNILNPVTPLSKYDYEFAGVLPVIKSKNGDEYFLLGREVQKDSNGDIVWSALGGGRDTHEDHPMATAAREFNEETKETVFNSGKDVQAYIDIDKGNTQNIIANTEAVLYITSFDYDMLASAFKTFYSKKMHGVKYNEIDELAWVKKDDLVNLIKSGNRVYDIKANIINADGTEDKGKTIRLRRFFVSLVRPYFSGDKYTCGKNTKILFFD